MKTLVIPDVHEWIAPVIAALDREGPDQVVFLGDWFDRFPSQPGDLKATLAWLQSNVANPAMTFLYGNHDMPYAFRHPSLLCSGHQHLKPEIYELFLSREAQAKFRLSVVVDGWTLSHAGFTEESMQGGEQRQGLVLDCLRRGQMSPMVAPGRARGGLEDRGGVTWLDWEEEFQPISDVFQVVGHTKGNRPRSSGDNWCIDTRLNHYAVIDSGDLYIMTMQGDVFSAVAAPTPGGAGR